MILCINNKTQSFNSISISLTETLKFKARKIATIASNFKIARQVYLNQLAVYAVKNYLDSSQILNSPASLAILNSKPINTDLLICCNKLLRCFVVSNDSSIIEIPGDCNKLTLGTIVVRLEFDCDNAELIGFVPPSSESQLVAVQSIPGIDNLINSI